MNDFPTTRLSVNINKIATLRNSRGGNVPNLLQVAKDCEALGAEGITVHPRPDERHITKDDAFALAELVTTEYNMEGYPDLRYLEMVKTLKPQQATLVPDEPGQLTSNHGWDTIKHQGMLKELVGELKAEGIRVSLFLDPLPELVEAAKSTGCDRIELYTGPYAEAFPKDPEKAIAPYAQAAKRAAQIGLGLNAGHDLDLENLRYFNEQLPNLLEVSIGHALICDALYYGLENTIQMYKRKLREQ